MKLLSHSNPSDKQLLRPLNSDEAPFQFLPQFTRFYRDHYHENLCIVYSAKLDAYLPLRLNFSRLFRHAQILHAPIEVKDYKELCAKDQLLFFNGLIRFLKEKNICQRLVQPHPYGILGALPPNVQSCEFGTYIIDLAGQTEEEIFENFHIKYQKAIAHSLKHGAEIKFGKEVFDDFYNIYSVTMKRVNIHGDDKTYFTKLYEHFGEDHVTPGVVYDNGDPVGAIFFIHTKYAGYCTHAGSHGGTKLYGAMKLLHFEMMKRLKKQGVKNYDLVGVRLKNNNPELEGIFRFKKGFGGEIKTGYLWKMDLRPMKARLYDMLLHIKNSNKRKTKDIIDQING